MNPNEMKNTQTVMFKRTTPTGKTWTAFCPYCAQAGQVTSRQLAWNPERGVLHCFTCGRGGLVAKMKLPDTGVLFEKSIEL